VPRRSGRSPRQSSLSEGKRPVVRDGDFERLLLPTEILVLRTKLGTIALEIDDVPLGPFQVRRPAIRRAGGRNIVT
jgi:hypothetical protein